MTRYSTTAMLLHWAIAALLMFNFGLGERTEDMERGPALFAVFQLHKSIGITILLLSLWRLWIRLRKPRPTLLGDSGWAHRLAEAVHWAFYAIMITVPVTGWIIVSTSKIKVPTLLFGLIPWPHLPFSGHALHELAEDGHGLLAKLMLALILLHVAGAIRHQFFKKEALLERMIPVSKASLGALGLAVALMGGSLALGRAGPLPGVTPDPTTTKPIAAAPSAPVAGAMPPAESDQPVALTEQEVIDESAKPEDATKPVADAKDNAGTAANGAVPQWQITPGGRLGFGVTVSGAAVQGQFSSWTGDIRFDAARLDQSAIRISIDLASVTSGDGQRDSMLLGSDFFDTSAHPRAVFTASDIKGKGGNRYEARGTLSMKGVSQPVRLDFDLDIKGDNADVRGSASLKRLDFGVGTGQFEGEDSISRTVPVTFAFSARKKG